MSEQHGPRIVQDGLVMCLDAANVKSFRGEPTTNLGNTTYLVARQDWINSGTYTQNNNETDGGKPVIPGFDTLNYRVISSVVTGVGSIHVGCCYKTGLSSSTTYTMSVYFRQNKAGISAPYLRTIVNNNSLGNFSYNGSTNSATWPVNEWIRITATGTTQSNETGLYLSNYIGTTVGDKIWYFGQQLEQLNHVTPLVAGTRGTTVATGGGFGDLTSNHHGTIVNSPLYSSSNNGCLLFDGVNDYITFGTGNDFFPLPEFTLDVWSKSSGLGSGMTAGGVISITYGIGFGYIGGGVFRFYLDDGLTFNSLYTTGLNLFDGVWHNIVATTTGAKSQIFVDGVYNNQLDCVWLGYSRWPTNTCYIGTDANNPPISYLSGYIGSLKVYNKILSNSEILQNYYALKGRYS